MQRRIDYIIQSSAWQRGQAELRQDFSRLCNYFNKMSKILLLGDSNIANNLQHQAILGKGQFEFKKCTTKGLFIDKILAAQADLIVMSGIDCVVHEALSATRESDRCITLVLNNFLAKISERFDDEAMASATVAIASPLIWDHFSDEVKKSLQSSFKQIRKDWKSQIKFIPPCPGLHYLQDKIHLDELSGVRYTNHIIKKMCSLVKINPNPAVNPSWADDVEMEMEDEDIDQDLSQRPQDPPTAARSASMTANRTPQLSFSQSNPVPNLLMQPNFAGLVMQPPPIHQISQHYPQVVTLPSQGPSNHDLLKMIEELSKRVETVEDKAFYDNLTFAAIKEDQDDVANKNNLNRVTITGVKIDDFGKLAENEKPPVMKTAVNTIIDLVTAEAEKAQRTVVFTRHRNQHIREARSVVIEARFQESKQAVAFRKDFVAKIKSQLAEPEGEVSPELKGLAVFPVQTLATRVRAALMKAMAKVIDDVTGPNITAYCQQYNTRPILKIVTKQGNSSHIQSLGFVDSVLKLKYNDDLHKVALEEAYQIAGANFRGRFPQHFIILKNK